METVHQKETQEKHEDVHVFFEGSLQSHKPSFDLVSYVNTNTKNADRKTYLNHLVNRRRDTNEHDDNGSKNPRPKESDRDRIVVEPTPLVEKMEFY